MKRYARQKKIFVSNSVASIWSGRAAPLAFFILSLVLLILSSVNSNLLENVRTGAADITAPVFELFSTPFNKVAEFTGNITGMAELRAENTKLIEENKRLNEWYQAALRLEAENNSLREILNVKIDQKYSFVTARVYIDAGNLYVHSYIVGAGLDDGVEKGQAVIGEKGVIGRIVEAGEKTARVLLLTDINSRIPVLIEGSNQRAILTGTNKDMPYLRHLPVDSQVEDGVRVITSGHGGVFPSGLPVGKLLKGDDGNLYVKPYSDMNSVRYVRIVNMPEIPNLINRLDEKELP